MAYTLENLEPKQVFHYFREISNIPRRSGNEKAASDYMVAFAKERGLEVIQDDYLNIIIRKPGTAGYESAEGVILQGHLDMVCEQNAGTGHDFEKDPIDLMVEGDWLTANGTTLGADNGIAIAYALAILDASDIPHPPLEVVFTTDEEVGLTGALQMDKSVLTSKYFINLDSEEEGEITVGCAGGLKASLHLPITYTTNTFEAPVVKQINITGLQGGHSGVDIKKHRANAARVLGRVLSHLRDEFSLRLVTLDGGSKDNVIPREASATLVIEDAHVQMFNDHFQTVVKDIKHELKTGDPDLIITEKTLTYSDDMAIFAKDLSDTVIFTLINAPNGIQTMSPDLEDMVESSLNLGVLQVEEDEVVFAFAVRSSVRSLKYHITNQLQWLAKQIGAKFLERADYPEWEFKPESNLLSQSTKIYEELFGKKALVKAIHAGLEGGAFLEKLPELDAISIGPDMEEVHTPNERLNIPSTERTWRYLKGILAALK